MSSTEWLQKHLGVSDYPTNYIEVNNFILLWLIFEKEILKTNPTNHNITAKIERIGAKLHNVSIDDVFTKQKEWYYKKEFDWNKFPTASVHQKDAVNAGFDEKNSDPNKKIVAVIMVIYLYRCNFFHGEKELNKLHIKQKDRLTYYNDFLIACLEANN